MPPASLPQFPGQDAYLLGPHTSPLQDTGGVGLSTAKSLFRLMAQLLWILEGGEERVRGSWCLLSVTCLGWTWCCMQPPTPWGVSNPNTPTLLPQSLSASTVAL